MAAPYDELLANLRGMAMASPHRLPVYDTSPSNRTNDSSHPTPSNHIPTTDATTSIFRSASISSKPCSAYASVRKAPSLVTSSRNTLSILSSRVESLHASRRGSVQESPASSRRSTSSDKHGDVGVGEEPHQSPSARAARCECEVPSPHKVSCIQSVTASASKSRVHQAKIRINSPFSLSALHGLFSSFGSEKRLLLDSIGLGGLLRVRTQRLQGRSLILFLLSNMDPVTGQEVVLSSRCPGVIPKLKELLGVDRANDITIEVVQSVLTRDYGRKMSCVERDAFKVAAMIYVDSCFLGPRGCKRTINKDILKHLADPSRISKVNWSGYVLRVLKSSSFKVQHSLMAGNKTVLVEGCLLFLLVFYLDNLNFGYMTPKHDILPRVAIYTPRLLAELLSYDRLSKPSHETLQYGRSKIRSCEEVVYSRRNGKETVTTSPIDVSGEQDIPPQHDGSDVQTSSGLQEDGHATLLDVQARLEEFIHDFTSQIHRSTDELCRKLVCLVSNTGQCASPLAAASIGVNEHVRTGVYSGNIRDNASESKRIITITTSSSGTSKHCDSPGLCVSSSLDHEGSKHQRTIQAEQTEPSVSAQTETQYAYPCSPFELKLVDNDIPVNVIIKVIRLLSKISDAECNMMWYIHDAPSTLEVSGVKLYAAFYKEEEFSIDIMSAVMRLYQELDDAMYQGITERRWRHYLPPQWVELAMMEQKASITHDISGMFAGELISYKVNECAMVLVPVYTGSNWSLYSWNFSRRTITIMDPVDNCMEKLVAKHDSTIRALHESMLFCINQILGSDMHSMNWNHNYAIDQDGCSTTSRSGLHTAFYARFFDGLSCRRLMLMDDSVTLFQTTLLCRVLGSNANRGSYPHAIRRAIAGIF